MKKITKQEKTVIIILMIFLAVIILQSLLNSIIVILVLIFGVFLSWILIAFLEKINATKILRYVSYTILSVIVPLLAYRLVYLFTPYLKNNFRGYDNFEEFLYYYSFSHPSIPFFRFVIETLDFFIFFDFFIIIGGILLLLNIGIGFLLHNLFRAYYLESKKREVKN